MYESLDETSQLIFDQPAAKTAEMALIYFMINGAMFGFYGAFIYTVYKMVRMLYT